MKKVNTLKRTLNNPVTIGEKVITEIFFEQLRTLTRPPKEQVVFLEAVEKRYVFYIYDGDKKLKMVVDLMKNSSTFVVTIY